MNQSIETALKEIEISCDVRILYACESGSRAWGFASPDSDYDVRFIYVHRLDWYLGIKSHRDVIERMLPGDLDVSGWELRKALGLFQKSNPPLLEWLSSPIVYWQDDGFMGKLRALVDGYYLAGSCFRHYLHTAEGNFRGYLQGELVQSKKYLYVLRPMLGCRWIEQRRGPVPMEFERLFVTIETEPDVLHAVKSLVAKKRSSTELGSEPRDAVLGGFVERELARLAATPYRREPLPASDRLDELFRETVAAHNGREKVEI